MDHPGLCEALEPQPVPAGGLLAAQATAAHVWEPILKGVCISQLTPRGDAPASQQRWSKVRPPPFRTNFAGLLHSIGGGSWPAGKTLQEGC